MSNWVIAYRGADRQEHELVAQASGALTEQRAAMIVSDFLRLQIRSQSAAASMTAAGPELYNFQIISIREDLDGTGST